MGGLTRGKSGLLERLLLLEDAVVDTWTRPNFTCMSEVLLGKLEKC